MSESRHPVLDQILVEGVIGKLRDHAGGNALEDLKRVYQTVDKEWRPKLEELKRQQGASKEESTIIEKKINEVLQDALVAAVENDSKDAAQFLKEKGLVLSSEKITETVREWLLTANNNTTSLEEKEATFQKAERLLAEPKANPELFRKELIGLLKASAVEGELKLSQAITTRMIELYGPRALPEIEKAAAFADMVGDKAQMEVAKKLRESLKALQEDALEELKNIRNDNQAIARLRDAAECNDLKVVTTMSEKAKNLINRSEKIHGFDISFCFPQESQPTTPVSLKKSIEDGLQDALLTALAAGNIAVANHLKKEGVSVSPEKFKEFVKQSLRQSEESSTSALRVRHAMEVMRLLIQPESEKILGSKAMADYFQKANLTLQENIEESSKQRNKEKLKVVPNKEQNARARAFSKMRSKVMGSWREYLPFSSHRKRMKADIAAFDMFDRITSKSIKNGGASIAQNPQNVGVGSRPGTQEASELSGQGGSNPAGALSPAADSQGTAWPPKAPMAGQDSSPALSVSSQGQDPGESAAASAEASRSSPN